MQQPTVAGKLTTRRSLHASGVAIISLAFLAFLPNVARAAFEVKPGSFRVDFSDDQAGAHANVTESFTFAQNGADGPVGAALRGAEVVFPVGFAGYPPAVKTCTPVQLQVEQCPPGAQIGTLEAVIREYPEQADPYITYRLPLYNMIPSQNQTAVFGFTAEHIIGGTIVVSVGPDYRVHARASNVVTGGVELVRQSITVWGVPADPSHNMQRGFSSVKFSSGPEEELMDP